MLQVKEGQMSVELIKTIIMNASERPFGLYLKIVSVCKVAASGEKVIRNQKPGVVVISEDGRVGFNVDGTSYMTVNESSGRNFLNWLREANEKALLGVDYGQPKGVYFDRCN